MQTVILAGGRGTRLSAVTNNIPKPMALIKGKPFLEYLLLMLKRNSLNDLLLCVGYLGDKVEAYFGDGRSLGMEIKYSYEKELLGTGGALKLAEGLIEKEFLLLYGDSYLDIDYGEFIEFFRKNGTIGSVVIYDNAMGDTEVKNNVAVEGDLIIRYEKHKDDPSLRYVEAGVSMFKKGLLEAIEPGRPVSLENDIFPLLVKNRELTGYKSKAGFCDIGTPERLSRFKELGLEL